MPTKLTDATVRGLKPNTEIRDSQVTGLIARRQTGQVSWTFVFRKDGAITRKTLGKYPGLSLADARTEAQALRDRVDAGRSLDFATTFGDLIDRYAAQLTAKRADEIKAQFKRHVVKERAIPLMKMRRADIQGCIDTLAKTTSPSVASSVGKYLRAAWRYGVSRGLVESDISTLLHMPYKTQPRQRVLNDDEIRVLLADWLPGGIHQPARSAYCCVFALALFTGCRRAEFGDALWSELSGNRLMLSAARSKGGRPTEVYLSPVALSLLEAWPRLGSPYIFPSSPRSPGGKPTSWAFDPAREHCFKRTGTSGWRAHDLRRTFGTMLARAGTPVSVVEAALNHQAPLLVRTYQIDAQREAVAKAVDELGQTLLSYFKQL